MNNPVYLHIYGLFFYLFKVVPVHAVKPGRAVDLQLPIIFNLGTRRVLSGQSDPPTNLHPGKGPLPVPV